MTEEQFKDHKDALIAQKLEPPCSLYEETEQHWEQIWERRLENNLLFSPSHDNTSLQAWDVIVMRVQSEDFPFSLPNYNGLSQLC